eukprot:6757648-Lingulodinium_polyedra.AAC.1
MPGRPRQRRRPLDATRNRLGGRARLGAVRERNLPRCFLPPTSDAWPGHTGAGKWRSARCMASPPGRPRNDR